MDGRKRLLRLQSRRRFRQITECALKTLINSRACQLEQEIPRHVYFLLATQLWEPLIVSTAALIEISSLMRLACHGH